VPIAARRLVTRVSLACKALSQGRRGSTRPAAADAAEVQVPSTAVNSGERMVPQIYSTIGTTKTGSLVYDDCSVTSN